MVMTVEPAYKSIMNFIAVIIIVIIIIIGIAVRNSLTDSSFAVSATL